jgi:lysophospholipase L1-like esterase
MKSKILSILALTILCQANGSSQLVANLKTGKEQVVVAYGTSLTEGGAWVRQLSGAIDSKFPGMITVINSGGSGQWSEWGLKNLDQLVIEKEPDTVFIEFGINDSVERFKGSPEVAKRNLINMIDRINKALPECEIILMTMTPGNKHPQGHRSYRKSIPDHYEMYRSVAKEKGLQLIDHYPNWIKLQETNPELFKKYVPDTIHPTAKGNLNVVTPVILDQLGVVTK